MLRGWWLGCVPRWQRVVEAVAGPSPVDKEVAAYVNALAARAKQIRLPELFRGEQPRAFYQRRDRHGASTIAIAQRYLSDSAVEAVLRFRLANALLYKHVDPVPMFERRAECEWWFSGSPDDILFFVGSSRTGEIACHSALAYLGGPLAGRTLRSADRELFETEQVFGRDVFLSLPIVPDLPLARLVESRRLVKTYWLDPLDELAFRAPMELGVASFHAMAGQLGATVDVVLGDITEEAERNLTFFSTAFVTLPRPLPPTDQLPVFHQEVEGTLSAPWAMLVSDVPGAAARVAAIEAALELAGRDSLRALLALRATTAPRRATALQP